VHLCSAHVPEGALRLVLLCLLTSLLALPNVAMAQVGGPKLHLGAGVALDFGGEVELDRGVNFNYGEADLEATFGLRGHLDYQVHRYVSLGGLVRMSWWEPEYTTSIDRSFLLDLGPRVIGHYDWRAFRFYGGLAPGLTISAIDDDGIGVSNPAAGFTLSLTLAGMEWWFSRKAGLFVELGWLGHWFDHDAQRLQGDREFHLSQGLFEFGVVFGA
jgi:hypothetical protein